jgi:ABC-type transport system involved in cytochrome c biogenesis permease subunit
MRTSVLLAVVAAGCFLGLAHAAVHTPREPFRRATSAMAALALALLLVAPAAGLALLAPVLLSRRLANAPVPATVEELLERYPA